MPDAPRVYVARPRELAPPPARDFLAELNPEQRAAAEHPDGPLLIVAGAGTGKTRTLVHRVAHLVARGVPPDRILLLTFTRRAAQEMLARAERLVGSASRRVHGGTFHATAHRLLRRFGAAAGLAADFTIMDQGDAEDLMQLSRAALGLGDARPAPGARRAAPAQRFPKKETLHHVYSRHVNTERPVAELLRDEYPRFAERADDFRRVYADYTERKARRNLVDYDDLLLFWALLLEQSPALGARVAGLYDHVLVDEYQDTNVLQARVLRGMCRAHRNITAVGDDAQSVYAFRGASLRNMLDFPSDFPGATVVTLEQNYRSTQPILDTSNAVIARAAERFAKRLWTARAAGERPWLVTCRDEQEQTRFVADRVLELHEEGTPLAEIAVLFRAGYLSANLEVELTARGVPYEKWGGIKFLEAAHVKDALAFLRVVENPRDEMSWYRVLLLLPGVGDVTARAAIDALAAADWDAAALGGFAVPNKARVAHAALVAMLADLARAASGGARADLVGEIDRVRAFYDPLLRERYDTPEPRLADLDQLQTIAAGYATRAAFLTSLALEPPSATHDLAAGGADDGDALVLSTAHSAKGKEWDAVFVLWAADGCFPLARAADDPDELEEERRLMYVALTRARDELYVTYPLNAYPSRYAADYSIDQLSRFIDRDVRETMQRVTLGAPPPEPAAPPPSLTPGLDLRALLRGRFSG